MRQRYHVSCLTGTSNWYWLRVGQGLLSLQQVRVEGECFYFFWLFTFIHFPPSPLFFALISSTISLLPFSWRLYKGLTLKLSTPMSVDKDVGNDVHACNNMKTNCNFKKGNFRHVPQPTQRIFRSICAFRIFWIANGASFLHVDNGDSDQTARMRRLI